MIRRIAIPKRSIRNRIRVRRPIAFPKFFPRTRFFPNPLHLLRVLAISIAGLGTSGCFISTSSVRNSTFLGNYSSIRDAQGKEAADRWLKGQGPNVFPDTIYRIQREYEATEGRSRR